MTRNQPVVRKSYVLLKYIGKMTKLSIYKTEKLLKNHAISRFHNNAEVWLIVESKFVQYKSYIHEQ